MPSFRLLAAVIILVAYLLVAGTLIYRAFAGAPAEVWSQVMAVFTAVGALATTAAGVLFGADIQQTNVDTANRTAAQEQALRVRREDSMRAALGALETNTALADPLASARQELMRGLGFAQP